MHCSAHCSRILWFAATAACAAALTSPAFAQSGLPGQGRRSIDQRYTTLRSAKPVQGALLVDFDKNGVIVSQDDRPRRVTIATTTLIMVAGESNVSAITPDSLLRVRGTADLSGRVINAESMDIIRLTTKTHNAAYPNLLLHTPWAESSGIEEARVNGMTVLRADILGRAASLSPLTVVANKRKYLVDLSSAKVMLKLLVNNPRPMCKQGDRVNVSFEAPTRIDQDVASFIEFIRQEPMTSDAVEGWGKATSRSAPVEPREKPKGKAGR